MKKQCIILLTGLALICVAPTGVHAYCQVFDDCSQCSMHPNAQDAKDNCAKYNTLNQGFSETGANRAVYKIYDCQQCNNGYILKNNTLELSPTCTIGYHSCTADPCAGGCSNCTTSAWSAAGTGYEKRTVATCNCKTCNKSTEYRCARGYYGSSMNGTTGCSRCPASGGAYGTTASAGSTAITACYIPSGTSFSDTTGSGTYTGNCYYKN